MKWQMLLQPLQPFERGSWSVPPFSPWVDAILLWCISAAALSISGDNVYVKQMWLTMLGMWLCVYTALRNNLHCCFHCKEDACHQNAIIWLFDVFDIILGEGLSGCGFTSDANSSPFSWNRIHSLARSRGLPIKVSCPADRELPCRYMEKKKTVALS